MAIQLKTPDLSEPAVTKAFIDAADKALTDYRNRYEKHHFAAEAPLRYPAEYAQLKKLNQPRRLQRLVLQFGDQARLPLVESGQTRLAVLEGPVRFAVGKKDDSRKLVFSGVQRYFFQRRAYGFDKVLAATATTKDEERHVRDVVNAELQTFFNTNTQRQEA